MKKTFALWLLAGLSGIGASAASAQQLLFKCVDAAGQIRFSDRKCDKGSTVPVKPVKDVDSPARKAANDALIQRDKALADRVESGRVANERSRYAGQDSQVQASKAIAASVEKERAQQQSSTQSVLPATTSLATQPPTN